MCVKFKQSYQASYYDACLSAHCIRWVHFCYLCILIGCNKYPPLLTNTSPFSTTTKTTHFYKEKYKIISLIADRRKCCPQGIMGRFRGRFRVNMALFDWLLFTLSSPIILSARHFRRSAIRPISFHLWNTDFSPIQIIFIWNAKLKLFFHKKTLFQTKYCISLT